MRILVVEDYAPTRTALASGLAEAGHAVDAAADGGQARFLAREVDYDVVVLDLQLPAISGLELLRDWRESGRPFRVLILSARDAVQDRVAGLRLGADDYLVKPFEFDELLARIEAVSRRTGGGHGPAIRVGDLEIDRAARTARRAGEAIDLTPREYALLELLARRAGELVTREEIFDGLYDFESSVTNNVLDVYISHLRRKVDRPGLPRLLSTRRGLGYVLGGAGQ